MVEMTEQDFIYLTGYIKKKFGIHLGKEKKALVEGRLGKILTALNITNVGEYYEYLLKDTTGNADIALVNAITTNHTFFMREASHFRYYADVVLPYWEKVLHDRDLRTWCAACSSGEEAYTLAMIIRDFFNLKNQNWDTKVLATDISLTALQTAKRGIYAAEAMESLPDKWRKIYFQRFDRANYQIRAELKAEVIFRQFNLISEAFPFKRKFHAIFCRNVMIYFDMKTRKELVEKFYQYLEPGGYLFIGHSEVLDRKELLFRYIMPSVYRKE